MSERVLICGVNWLGDAVMSMPALQLFKRRHPSAHVVLLVKAPLAGLWSLSPAVDAVAVYDGRTFGTLAAAREARRHRFEKAFVLPNSFRSALIPFLAGIPERTGAGGRRRGCLLTQRVDAAPRGVPRHQAWEFVRILKLDPPDDLEPCRLEFPEPLPGDLQALLRSPDRAPIGLIPGAARGPAKRWPPAHFVAVGRALARDGERLLVLGAPAEEALCGEVADGIGEAASNLAGRTSVPQFTAVLSHCRAAVTNDSGGMHLAAAAGTRVVAVYGLTDPARTGPLGPGHRIVTVPGVQVSRDISRDSAAARACLESIAPEEVLSAVREVLDE